MHRSLLLGLLGLCLLVGDARKQTYAQANYPQRAVRIVVPSSPGGGTDILARVLADHFAKTLGGQFFVENRPGAGQSIGIEAVARSAPDGYTIVMVASTLALNPIMFKNIRYDPVKDFAPISMIASAPLVIVANLGLPAKSINELMQLARSRPGQLNYASSGTGTIAHLSAELFNAMAKIKLQHVPYKGTGPALTDVLSGQVQLMFNSAVSILPQVRANRLRALAVTSTKRIAPLPDVPSVAEAGVPGYEAASWYGVLAPARTPRNIIDRLHAEIAKAVRAPDVHDRLAGEGAEPVGNSPEAFAAFIARELQRWAKVIQDAGIRAE